MTRAAHRLRSSAAGRVVFALVVFGALAWPATAAGATQPLVVSLSPCAAATASGPCRDDPAQVQVAIPNDGTVKAVELLWVPDGRPSAAPSPSQSQVVLTTVSSGPGEVSTRCQNAGPAPSSAFTMTCWDWPSSLDYPAGGTEWLLNGTYRLVPCSATSSSTPCTAMSSSAAYGPADVGVAVPPSTPTGVASRQANGVVYVTWNTGPEPDLAGYSVARNNQVVYRCSTPAGGTSVGPACGSQPAFSDQPGGGNWTYSVSALRLGADASPSDVVSSAPSSTSLALAFPKASGGATGGAGSSGGNPGRAFVPPLPATGELRPAGQFAASTGVIGNSVPSLAETEDSGGALSGTPGNLSYGDNPALGGPLASGTLQHTQRIASSVDGAAELAVAVLALALAVHAWYLRGELRAASVRVAARRAASGTAM